MVKMASDSVDSSAVSRRRSVILNVLMLDA